MAVLNRVDENFFKPQVVLLAPNEELVNQIWFEFLSLGSDNQIEASTLTRFGKSKQPLGFLLFIE